MNRFVKTALAIAVAGSAAHAGTGDNEWTALDSEISRLATSLKPSEDGSGWAALIRAVYSHSSDDIATGTVAPNPDTSGFNFNDVDLAFWGNQGPYTWRLSADIDSNTNDAGLGGAFFVLEDAYIACKCGGYLDARMGQFKPHVTRSNSVDPEKQLFIDRTVLGAALDFFDDGIGLSGSQDVFSWYAAVMDGQNGHEKNHFYFARGEFNLGSGAGEYEGAMGSSDQLNATIGLSVLHDDTNGDVTGNGKKDNTSAILDFNGNVSNVGFGAEIARLDNDAFAITSGDYSNIFDSGDGVFPNPLDPLGGTQISGLLLAGDSTPWSLTGSYLVSSDWEFAVRYENLDNGGNGGPDNTVLSLGANWYRGNAGRWQAQFTKFNADGNFNDGNILEVGYAVGASR